MSALFQVQLDTRGLLHLTNQQLEQLPPIPGRPPLAAVCVVLETQGSAVFATRLPVNEQSLGWTP